jgi:hypothetical protein
MAIQFGYLTLFAVAFPAAPLAALLNNLIEGHTDLLKLLKSYQRPHPREAANIGTWLEILETMSYLSTIVNSLIIVFTSKELAQYSLFTRLFIGLTIEHLLFFIKYVISKTIPDTPTWVAEAFAKKTYYKQLAIDQAIQARKDAKRIQREAHETADPIVNLEEYN